MDLIVISNPNHFKQEANLINALFSEGLNTFHLRKPNESVGALKSILSQIRPMYYKNIVVHSHLGLAKDFGLGGVHLVGNDKIGQSSDKLLKTIKTYQEGGFTVSTSVHTFDELMNTKLKYDYVLASPVFDSISKPGHTPKFEWDIKPVKKLINAKPIALGGINESNIKEAKTLGFEGVAVMGAVWEPENVVDNFKAIKAVCQEFALSY